MQTNSQSRSDLPLFNPEVARRSLLKFGIAAVAGAWLPKTVLAMQIPVPQDVPDFLMHIDRHEPRLRYRNLVCGTCFASLNLHRP
jgi:hypothetical protein